MRVIVLKCEIQNVHEFEFDLIALKTHNYGVDSPKICLQGSIYVDPVISESMVSSLRLCALVCVLTKYFESISRLKIALLR